MKRCGSAVLIGLSPRHRKKVSIHGVELGYVREGGMSPYDSLNFVPTWIRVKGGTVRNWVAPTHTYTGFHPDAQPDFACLRVTQRGWLK